MDKGYSRIFWGLVIATFNIKLGVIKILPAFVGFLIIFSGVKLIYEERPTERFKAAQTIALNAAIAYFISESIALIAPQLEYSIYSSILIIIASIIELLMVKKIIQGSVEYLNEMNKDTLASLFIKKEKKYTLLYSISIAILAYVLIFNIQILNATIAIALIFLRVYVMSMINNLKKFYLHKES